MLMLHQSPLHIDKDTNVPWKSMVNAQGYNLLGLHTKWDHEQAELIMGDGENAFFYSYLSNDFQKPHMLQS